MSALIPLMVRGITWRWAYHGEVYTMARGIPWRGVHHGEGNTMAMCIPWRGVYHDEVYAMATDIPWRGVYHYIIKFISNVAVSFIGGGNGVPGENHKSLTNLII
jgi:hypothetical protein